MLDRLSTMRQDLDNCAQRVENLGSVDNLDETDLPENTPIYNLAEQVNTDLQQATDEVIYLSLYNVQTFISYFMNKTKIYEQDKDL